MPLIEETGPQLQVIGIDTSQQAGSDLYQATIDMYEVPPPRQGVPTLVVGDTVLVGDIEIPGQFPDLVEEGLAGDGIDWPAIPGLLEVLPPEALEDRSPINDPATDVTPETSATSQVTEQPVLSATEMTDPTPSAEASATLPPTEAVTNTAVPSPAPTSQSALAIGEDELPSADEVTEPPPDPVGFALAGVVMLGMVLAFIFVVVRLLGAGQSLSQWESNPVLSTRLWAVPVLVLVGLVVASYLAHVEITQAKAVCGPIGECNIVQSSPYAQILEIPIAVLGLLNYLVVGILWIAKNFLPRRLAYLSALGLLVLTMFGTLFSVYLTGLELFVIRAVCAWCLSSAVISTILMLLVAVPITSKPSDS